MYSIHLALNCRHLTTDTVCFVSVRPIINLYTVSQKVSPTFSKIKLSNLINFRYKYS